MTATNSRTNPNALDLVTPVQSGRITAERGL